MTSNSRRLLELLAEAAITSVGSAAGKDLYEKAKEEFKLWLENRTDAEKSTISRFSGVKPGAFYAMEIDRIASGAAAYLLRLPAAERQQLISLARQGTNGNEEKALMNLIALVQLHAK